MLKPASQWIVTVASVSVALVATAYAAQVRQQPTEVQACTCKAQFKLPGGRTVAIPARTVAERRAADDSPCSYTVHVQALMDSVVVDPS